MASAWRGRSRRRSRAAGACLIGGFLCLSAVGSHALEPGEVWVSRFDGPAHLHDRANAVAVSPDGTAVFVTGWIEVEEADTNYGTLAYDVMTGEELWASSYDGPAGEFFDRDIANDLRSPRTESMVFVTGESARSESDVDNDFATVA